MKVVKSSESHYITIKEPYWAKKVISIRESMLGEHNVVSIAKGGDYPNHLWYISGEQAMKCPKVMVGKSSKVICREVPLSMLEECQVEA